MYMFIDLCSRFFPAENSMLYTINVEQNKPLVHSQLFSVTQGFNKADIHIYVRIYTQ